MNRVVVPINLLVSVSVLLASCLSTSKAQTAVPAVEQTQLMLIPDDIRNVLVCEVLLIYRDGLKLHLDVYNSMGLNDCPAEVWTSLDAEEMAKEYGAVSVLLNGPRYQLMNEIIRDADDLTGVIGDFEGMQMRHVAQLEFPIWRTTSRTYHESSVEKNSTHVYHAGTRVFELISRDGTVYRMQSYSQKVDSDLTIDDLETLGEKLDLPRGWTYRTSVLSEDSALTAKGTAYVIQEEFENSYMKIP